MRSQTELQDELPNLSAPLDDIDAAINDLEQSLDTPELDLPELNQAIESLQLPDEIPADDVDVDRAVDDALETLDDTGKEPLDGELIPDLLN